MGEPGGKGQCILREPAGRLAELHANRDDGRFHPGNEIGKACWLHRSFGRDCRRAERKIHMADRSGGEKRDAQCRSGSKQRQSTRAKEPAFWGWLSILIHVVHLHAWT